MIGELVHKFVCANCGKVHWQPTTFHLGGEGSKGFRITEGVILQLPLKGAQVEGGIAIDASEEHMGTRFRYFCNVTCLETWLRETTLFLPR